jgi:hypothetical protein
MGNENGGGKAEPCLARWGKMGITITIKTQSSYDHLGFCDFWEEIKQDRFCTGEGK